MIIAAPESGEVTPLARGHKSADATELTIVPITLRAANEFVAIFHRHHKPARGHKFSIGVDDPDGTLRGVAIVGRPSARHYDDGTTAEVVRTCTGGWPNANSALYGAAWRAGRGMGYRTMITYTQDGESGASLRAAGWVNVAKRKARKSWAASSVAMRDARDPVGTGGIARDLWAIGDLSRWSPNEQECE